MVKRGVAQVRLDRRYEECDASMYRSIYTHVALRGACDCLRSSDGSWAVSRGSGGWTLGLGATPGSWLGLRSKVTPVRVELSPSSRRPRWCASSCSQWRGRAGPCSSIHVRLVGRLGKRGVAQLRLDSRHEECNASMYRSIMYTHVAVWGCWRLPAFLGLSWAASTGSGGRRDLGRRPAAGSG